MMDLHSRMQRMAGPVDETPDAVIQDDLARGHQAVRRRRIVQGGAGSVFAVAAVAAALSLNAGVIGGPAAPPVAAPSANAPAVTTANIQLVSYTGKQPNLFTIDTVPQGFYVQGQNEYELVLAPQGAKRPDPDEPLIYTDKIAVFLQNRNFTGTPAGDKLTIDGKPATLYTNRTDGATGRVEGNQIYILASPHVYLTVQFDVTTGLTTDQMIKIAGGIHVNAKALAEIEPKYAAETAGSGKK